jgi:hypothetical protein
MYEDIKMELDETILTMGRGGIKENEGGCESKLNYKHFHIGHNLPQVQ